MANDDLLQMGAGLLESAQRAGTDVKELDLKNREQANQALQTGTKQLADTMTRNKDIRAQKETAAAAQAGETKRTQMQIDANQTTITPELAEGLARHSRDEGWKKAVGQKMDTQFLLGVYTHQMKQTLAPKYVTLQNGGKSYHAMVWIDENGEEHKQILDEGGPKWNPKAGSGGKGGTRASLDPKDKEFMKSYRGYMKDTEGINLEIAQALAKKGGPAGKQGADLLKKLKFQEDNKARFEKLQGIEQPAEGGEAGGGDQKKQKEYKSAEEVKADFRAGTLSRDQAKKILADKFGMK